MPNQPNTEATQSHLKSHLLHVHVSHHIKAPCAEVDQSYDGSLLKYSTNPAHLLGEIRCSLIADHVSYSSTLVIHTFLAQIMKFHYVCCENEKPDIKILFLPASLSFSIEHLMAKILLADLGCS